MVLPNDELVDAVPDTLSGVLLIDDVDAPDDSFA